jgi:hypothetical protein
MSLQRDLGLIEQEFSEGSVPYERRSKIVQFKINRVMNAKALDIKNYAKQRSISLSKETRQRCGSIIEEVQETKYQLGDFSLDGTAESKLRHRSELSNKICNQANLRLHNIYKSSPREVIAS